MNNDLTNSISEKGNSSKAKAVVMCVSLAVFLFIIFLPMCLILFGGAEDGSLSYEQSCELPKFTVGTYADASFQKDFEGWFSTNYAFRANIVLAYNQLKYDIDSFTLSPVAEGVNDDLNSEDIDMISATADDSEDEKGLDTVSLTPELIDTNSVYADINKLRIERPMKELSGYKGTNTVYIGKSGYLYENGYINEYYGYSAMYRDCTYEDVQANVEKLLYIQKRLEEMGKVFIFVTTPSKASAYPDAIPDWYVSMNVKPEGYIRPYDNLLEILKDSGLNYIDSATLYEEVGLQETFPKTGIHWNKLASYETSAAILDMYAEISGDTIMKMASNGILSSKSPPGFGNPEQDIYGAVYSSISKSESVVDDLYYWHDSFAEKAGEGSVKRLKVLIQGGSFAHDILHYYTTLKIATKVTRCYYNSFPNEKVNPYTKNSEWEKMLKDMDLIVFEVNEQFVRSMGANAPYWANDKIGYDIGRSIYDSLIQYLKSTEEAK